MARNDTTLATGIRFLLGLLVFALVPGLNLQAEELRFVVGDKFEIVRAVLASASQSKLGIPDFTFHRVYYWKCQVVPPIEPNCISFNATLTRNALLRLSPDSEGEIDDTDIANQGDILSNERELIGARFLCQFDQYGNFAVIEWPDKVKERMKKELSHNLEQWVFQKGEVSEKLLESRKEHLKLLTEQQYRDDLFPNFFYRNADDEVSLQAAYRFRASTGCDVDLSLKELVSLSQAKSSIERKKYEVNAKVKFNSEDYGGGLTKGNMEFNGLAKVHFHPQNHIQIFGEQRLSLSSTRWLSPIEMSKETEGRTEGWTINPIAQ